MISFFSAANKDYIQDAGIGFTDSSETHAGEDVPLHARGPMSHLFGGVHEQSYIAHAIMYAGCMGEKHITPGAQQVQGFLLT